MLSLGNFKHLIPEKSVSFPGFSSHSTGVFHDSTWGFSFILKISICCKNLTVFCKTVETTETGLDPRLY